MEQAGDQKTKHDRTVSQKTHLTQKLLPVFVPCSSDVVAGSQLLFSTPGVQEVLDVRHGGLTDGAVSSSVDPLMWEMTLKILLYELY